MTLKIVSTNKFLKDVGRSKKRGFDIEKLKTVIGFLYQGKDLPKKHRPHMLFGEWNDCWECHISPDWLLIYRFEFKENEIHLLRTGTHSDLF
jgi:mRNA interferase YafQ